MSSAVSVRETVDVAIDVLAEDVLKQHRERGETIARAKAKVIVLKTPQGRGLIELRRHKDAWMTPAAFKKAQKAKLDAIPEHMEPLVEVAKRAQGLVAAGVMPTIEQARVKVRHDDRELAEREREARKAFQS